MQSLTKVGGGVWEPQVWTADTGDGDCLFVWVMGLSTIHCLPLIQVSDLVSARCKRWGPWCTGKKLLMPAINLRHLTTGTTSARSGDSKYHGAASESVFVCRWRTCKTRWQVCKGLGVRSFHWWRWSIDTNSDIAGQEGNSMTSLVAGSKHGKGYRSPVFRSSV